MNNQTLSAAGGTDPVSSGCRACPVCGEAERLAFLCDADGHAVYTCARCGADHVFPMPGADALKAYYDRPAWFEGGERGGYEDFDRQTGWSSAVLEPVLDRFAGRKDLSLLDVGCGYGAQLAVAAARGWKCFGVELSDHARKIAKERLGDSAYVVESAADLVPHAFDVVLMLDTLEHLPSPYPVLYQLFSIGAITPETLLVISTPNAGSAEAVRNPAAWAYRHPPSHLVYYTAQTLEYLLRRLHFTDVAVCGIGGDGRQAPPGGLAESAGLLVTASGSNFTEFMRERYVPGTWSKIAAYEHMPRYVLAKSLAAGKEVLDFGCGTGYGAAMMAETAARVVGLDIDGPALDWAREMHRNPRLEFVLSGDFGAALPDASFDFVTCLEMIEHVDHDMQKAAVAAFARLLRKDGFLLISTPNPEVTKLYGANPYHIREMTAAELRELLVPHFPHVRVLSQHVKAGVTIGPEEGAGTLSAAVLPGARAAQPLAFLALCSRAPVPDVPAGVFFDDEEDYIRRTMAQDRVMNALRLENHGNIERAHNRALERDAAAAHSRNLETHSRNVEAERDGILAERNAVMAERDAVMAEREAVKAEKEAVRMQLDMTLAEKARVQLHLEQLAKTRDMEHRSPRFLARQFWRALSLRLRERFGGSPGPRR